MHSQPRREMLLRHGIYGTKGTNNDAAAQFRGFQFAPLAQKFVLDRSLPFSRLLAFVEMVLYVVGLGLYDHKDVTIRFGVSSRAHFLAPVLNYRAVSPTAELHG